MHRDRCSFEALDERVNLRIAGRGHYGIPLFDNVRQGSSVEPQVLSEECLEVGTSDTNGKNYFIDALEGLQQLHGDKAALDQEQVSKTPAAPRGTSESDGAQGNSTGRGQPRDEEGREQVPDADCPGSNRRHKGTRHLRRSPGGRCQPGSGWRPDDDRGQVQVSQDVGADLPRGEGVCRVGSESREERETYVAYRDVSKFNRIAQVDKTVKTPMEASRASEGSSTQGRIASPSSQKRRSRRNSDLLRRDPIVEWDGDENAWQRVADPDVIGGQQKPARSGQSESACDGGVEPGMSVNRKTRRRLRSDFCLWLRGNPRNKNPGNPRTDKPLISVIMHGCSVALFTNVHAD